MVSRSTISKGTGVRPPTRSVRRRPPFLAVAQQRTEPYQTRIALKSRWSGLHGEAFLGHRLTNQDGNEAESHMDRRSTAPVTLGESRYQPNHVCHDRRLSRGNFNPRVKAKVASGLRWLPLPDRIVSLSCLAKVNKDCTLL